MNALIIFYVAVISVILLVEIFDRVEKYRISKMNPQEKIAYLIKRYGKDYTEHL